MIKAIAIDDELPALKIIENFCEKMPRSLKHVDIDISDINQIKILIEKLNYLTSF